MPSENRRQSSHAVVQTLDSHGLSRTLFYRFAFCHSAFSVVSLSGTEKKNYSGRLSKKKNVNRNQINYNILQVSYYLKSLDGETLKLPDRGTMEEEAEQDYRKRIIDMKMPPKHAHKMGPLQWGYFEELANLSDIGTLPPVHEVIYNVVADERLNNVMFYKKEDYKLLSAEEYKRIMPEP